MSQTNNFRLLDHSLQNTNGQHCRAPIHDVVISASLKTKPTYT